MSLEKLQTIKIHEQRMKSAKGLSAKTWRMKSAQKPVEKVIG